MRVDYAHPAAVLAGVAVAVVVRVLEAPAPMRPLMLGSFLLVCPGAALVGNPRTWSRLAWWTVVLAASVALSTLVSTALLYVDLWTADRVFGVLAVGSAIGCLAHLARARPVSA